MPGLAIAVTANRKLNSIVSGRDWIEAMPTWLARRLRAIVQADDAR
jgi:hypothetical protein